MYNIDRYEVLDRSLNHKTSFKIKEKGLLSALKVESYLTT